MTSQCKMLFPFTTQKEICDWETCYNKAQTVNRRGKEQTVINLQKKVEARQTQETPGGYLLRNELKVMAGWKHHTLPSKIKENSPECVKKITAAVFGLDNDWEKLMKLTALHGVRQSVASVILHLYDRKKYPILDHHALRSVGICEKYVYGPEYPFWQEYVDLCREKAECYDVCMRTLDRALWKYSESGTAASHSR